jgi:Protein of unknown function (DUF992)
MKYQSVLAAAAMTAFAAAGPTFAEEHVKAGTLRCEVSAGLGLIVASTKEMACVFTSVDGRAEHYHGRIHKFGLDVGATSQGVLAWDVFAPTAGPRRGALAGDYAGVAASATVGVGAGANALVGGSHRSFTLQPLSVQVQTGLDLSAGVASMTLRRG